MRNSIALYKFDDPSPLSFPPPSTPSSPYTSTTLPALPFSTLSYLSPVPLILSICSISILSSPTYLTPCLSHPPPIWLT